MKYKIFESFIILLLLTVIHSPLLYSQVGAGATGSAGVGVSGQGVGAGANAGTNVQAGGVNANVNVCVGVGVGQGGVGVSGCDNSDQPPTVSEFSTTFIVFLGLLIFALFSWKFRKKWS